jgi:hypothetical protein
VPLHCKKLMNIGNFVLLWTDCERDSGPGVKLEGRFSLGMIRRYRTFEIPGTSVQASAVRFDLAPGERKRTSK